MSMLGRLIVGEDEHLERASGFVTGEYLSNGRTIYLCISEEDKIVHIAASSITDITDIRTEVDDKLDEAVAALHKALIPDDGELEG